MICFPNSKINLGLSITHKRNDGFHDIDTVFAPIALQDALEFIPSDELVFTSTGIQIPGDSKNNIILKAYHLLKNDYPDIPHLQIHLLKNIPTGAGLGGGSADASFMLNALNDYFKLNISIEKRLEYALTLGSDCPFFILNKSCKAQGRGEIIQKIELNLQDATIVLIKPDIHINTAWAFSQIKPQQVLKSPSQIVSQDISYWKDELVNDFEKPIFGAHPTLKLIKDTLYELGADYAAMSGSGSVLFGIFSNQKKEANEFLNVMKNAFAPNLVYISKFM